MAQFISNNKINLLQNGEEYFPAMEAALDQAMHEIYLESYIFENDNTGKRIVEALKRAAFRGVKTHLLIDGFGSIGLPKTIIDDFEAAGVMVLKFRSKTAPWTLRRRRLRRLHRKIVVVDREIAFVGGINIVDDIESLTNFRKFMSAARSVSRVKPIIVLKSGRSPAGAKAAASHTGAMAGEDAVYDAAFKRAGIVRVNTIEELFDCAELMAKQPRPRGPRLAILTNGGGPGVMATDMLARYGQEPAPLDPETIQALDAFLPPFWSRGNPIDILGDASAERFRRALEVCFNSKNLDGVLVILAPQALTDPLSVAETLAAAMQERRYPVFACWMGGKRIATAVDVLNAAGIPTYDTPERAVRAFLYMVEYTRNLEMLLEVPPKMTGRMVFDQEKARKLIAAAPDQEFLPETDSKEILAAYGLPVIRTEIAETEAQASRIGREMGYLLVMKVHSADITHKTEADGIRLDLRCDADVCEAYNQIISSARRYKPDARIEG